MCVLEKNTYKCHWHALGTFSDPVLKDLADVRVLGSESRGENSVSKLWHPTLMIRGTDSNVENGRNIDGFLSFSQHLWIGRLTI